MPIEIWPGSDTLPQNFAAQGFSEAMADNTLTDDYQLGPPVYRRRTTSAPIPFIGQMYMTTAEWETLSAFFHTTLFDGVMRFLFPPQGTIDQSRFWICRFVTPPTRQMTEADDLWAVSLSLERLGSSQGFLTPVALAAEDVFYSPTVQYDQFISFPALFGRVADNDIIYSPEVIAGGVDQTLTPSRFGDAETFRVPAVTTEGGPQSISASLLADADTFRSVSVQGGSAILAASRFSDAETFYTPVVNQPGSGYFFNMTAGNYGGLVQGYGDGFLGISIGSIDDEPIPEESLALCYYYASVGGGVYFHGDLMALLTGLEVWVDSVLYPFDTDWSYDVDNDVTIAAWNNGNQPIFIDTGFYFIEIK